MQIKLNKQLDKEMYLSFCDAVVGGVDFGAIIKKDHPSITKENYSEYINNFYSEHINELEIARKDTERCFNEIKDVLFSELKRYFKKDFNSENYTCFLSIFDCNPRFLENKTFQVFYRRPRHLRKEVIAHELTHFAFYYYCSELRIKESKELWELSEIFNVVFLNIQGIQKAIGAEEMLFYPNLKEKLEAIKLIWAKNLNAEEFIKTSLSHLTKNIDSSNM